jgi:hypothetical protein
VNRIEVSPLFKISQENNLKYINPLVRIFKASDNMLTEHSFVPLNPEHLNYNRYERQEVKHSNLISELPEAKVVFKISDAPIYQKLSPNLHKFDYVY